MNRQGAAVLAVKAVFEALGGGPPATVQLFSYRISHASEPEDLAAMERSNEIADQPATLYLGFIRHILEIEADDTVFRVSVDGRETTAGLKSHRLQLGLAAFDLVVKFCQSALGDLDVPWQAVPARAVDRPVSGFVGRDGAIGWSWAGSEVSRSEARRAQDSSNCRFPGSKRQ